MPAERKPVFVWQKISPDELFFNEGEAMWKQLKYAHYLGFSQEHPIPRMSDPRALRMLAKSKDPGTRFWIARHPCTPPEVLEELSKDASWPIRMAVAWHKDTPEHVLHILWNDPEKAVWQALAMNPAAPADLVFALLEDPLKLVRERAERNLTMRGYQLEKSMIDS
jgi:hypothetical protein